MTLRFTHIAVIGALAAALAGCGRKGPLDLPPGAATAPPARAASPVGLSPLPERTPTAPSAFDSQGRPMAPTNAPKKRLPMDWLID